MAMLTREPPGPTLRDLLDVPELQLRLVSGTAEQLDRSVRWAHSTELLRPDPYLRGGELVCTVGSALVDRGSCSEFVTSLSGVGASGVCFGTGDVHPTIPAALLRECQQQGLALFELPHGVRFLALSEYLAQERMSAGAAASSQLMRLTDRLLAAVRQKTPVPALLSMAELELGGRLVLHGTDGRPAEAGPGRPEATTGPALSAPISEGGTLRWTPGPGGVGGEAGTEILAQIARVIDVACYEEELGRNNRRERLGHLFGLVADGLADVAALFPDFSEAGLVTGEVTVSAWPPGTVGRVGAHFRGAVLGDAPDAVYVVAASGDRIRHGAQELGLTCGYGSTVPLLEVARSISEARACLEIAERTSTVVGPESLTSLTGLLEQQPRERLAPFVDHLLGPLRDHDRRHGTRLLETLRAFLRNDGALQTTARAEYLHVNTVRNRLARVAQLTGRDPLTFDGRAALQIAVWASDRPRPRFTSR